MYCKECTSAKNKAKYASDSDFRERRIEYVQGRYKENPEAAIERTRRWRQEHPEKKLAQDRAWREANRERAREIALRYVDRHREEVYARTAEYRRKNPGKALEHVHRRRARLEGAGGTYTAQDIETLFLEQQGVCLYCGAPIEDDFHIDHFLPLSRGGSNWPENLVLACPTCNMSKFTKMPWEFMPERFSRPE